MKPKECLNWGKKILTKSNLLVVPWAFFGLLHKASLGVLEDADLLLIGFFSLKGKIKLEIVKASANSSFGVLCGVYSLGCQSCLLLKNN